MSRKTIKIISIFLCFLLIIQQSLPAGRQVALAQVAGQLNLAGRFSTPNPGLTLDKFRPIHLRYLSYDNIGNSFKLLVDKGDSKELKSNLLQDSTKKLLEYFLVGVTLPNSSFWVNLRPDSEDNVIDAKLARTDIGKVLLEADLQLKKDTAKFTSPETPEGRKYWEKIYRKAEELFGSAPSTIPTLTRPWIVPGEVIVRESKTSAYIYKAILKVMLEKDYLKNSDTYNFKDERLRKLNDYSSELLRELIIPKLTKEVNTSRKYASLRQVYYSLILAQWFKNKFRGQGGLYSWLIDKVNLNGLTSKEPWSKTAYFKEYQRSFAQGEYNIQEPQPTLYGASVRSYFSGGIALGPEINAAITGPGKVITGNLAKDQLPSGSHNFGLTVKGGSIENPLGIEISATNVEDVRSSVGVSQGWNKVISDELRRFFQEQGITRYDEVQFNKLAEIINKALLDANGLQLIDQDAISKTLNENNIDIPGFNLKKFINALVMLMGGVPAQPSQNLSAAPELVRESKEAFGYVDPAQGFAGVDLEHFVYAQTILRERGLADDVLKQVLAKLGLGEALTGEAAYSEIYAKLSTGYYSQEIIDLINQDKYSDPRLSVAIVDQNQNPRAQSIYEAVANSLDALDFKIGQFGKGVKQILDWLEPTGEDRLDVFTRKTNGKVYQLTILKDRQGQNYLQIKEISQAAFQNAAKTLGDLTVEHGTIVIVSTKNSIPLTDSVRDASRRNSQEGIVEGIHKRFPFVTAVEIITQIKDKQEKVNGFEEKTVIVPSQAASSPRESQGKRITVIFTDHRIAVADNGAGMDAETLSRMFVPKQGTKTPQFLSGEKAGEQLDKVKVVQDATLPHRVSFARNTEVVVAIDIPGDIHPDATVAGGLMMEFGLLVGVPESRDKIIIPLDLRAGDVSGFQQAVEYMVKQIVVHPHLSSAEKAKYINTIVVGLDGLIQGNQNYEHVIKGIRANIQKLLKPIIDALEKEGYIILPHDKQFEKLAIPQGKKPFFIHENLFSWQGAASLKEIGAKVVGGITLAGDKKLSLVVVPFQRQYLRNVSRFNKSWHTLAEGERLPIIKTERFIAVPEELGARLNELAAKRLKGLSQEENKEFLALLQLINIVTAEEIVTSYEVGEVKSNLNLEQEDFEKSSGQIDSESVNKFLVEPLVAVQGPSTKPAGNAPVDTNQKYVLLANGDVVEVGTRKKVLEGIKAMEPLMNGYYKITKFSMALIEQVVRIAGGAVTEITDGYDTGRIILSPDKRFVYAPGADYVFDTQMGLKRYFASGFGFQKMTTGSTYDNIQFSPDNEYMACFETDRDHGRWLTVFDMHNAKIIKRIIISATLEHTFNFNPFASHIIFMQDKPTNAMWLVDLKDTSGVIGAMTARFVSSLHTDSSGSYTVIIDFGKIQIYLHKAQKLLTSKDFAGQRIKEVVTEWIKGKLKFMVVGDAPEPQPRTFFFDEDGKVMPQELGKDTQIMPDGSEHFRSEGTKKVFLKAFLMEEDHISNRDYSVDPLQRLDKEGIYKHPKFELFIDNSDPINPVALDAKTGKKFPFHGEIISYNAQNSILQYSDGGLYAITNGKIGATQGEAKASDRAHKLFVNIFRATDQPTVYFLISPDKEIEIPIGLDYSSVTFDGKYFVFTNPKTADVAYLDPNNPLHPIFVSAGSTATTITKEKSQDAPDDFIIVKDRLVGRYRVVDAQKGIPSRMTMDSDIALSSSDPQDMIFEKIVRISPQAYIGHTEHDPVIFKKGKIIFDSREHIGKHTVIQHAGKLLVLKVSGPIGPVSLFIVDTESGKQYRYEDSAEIHLSASGRYIVVQLKNGDLMYYDFQETNPRARYIHTAGKYLSYRVHDKADIMIVEYQAGKYELVGLEEEQAVIQQAAHIEIDSSSQIAIVKPVTGKKIAYRVLRGLVPGTAEYTSINVASDERFIYILSTDDDTRQLKKGFIEIYSKKDGFRTRVERYEDYLKLSTETEYYRIPRFFESYDSEKKTIWDRETGKTWRPRRAETITEEIVYKSNPPTHPTNTLLLNGAIVTATSDEAIFKCQLGYSATGKTVGLMTPGGEESKIGALEGDKVWYWENERGIPVIRLVTEEGLVEPNEAGKIFLNGSKTFFLRYDDNGRFFILDKEGKTTEISDKIPLGFYPIGTNGKYFVLHNPSEEILYFNPESPIALTSVGKEQALTSGAPKVLNLWQDSVASKRKEFIQQAQDAYQPFLNLIPQEHRKDIELAIQKMINGLYEEQEKEIRKRFEAAVKEGKNVDFDAPLPFDLFSSRMQRIMQVLPGYLKGQELVLSQERYSIQKDYYFDLLVNLFELSLRFDLTSEDINAELLEPLALGWAIDFQEKLNLIPVITNLIFGLREASSGQISIEQLGKIVELLTHAASRNPQKIVENTNIIKNQLLKILAAKFQVKKAFLTKLRDALAKVETIELLDAIYHPDKPHNLGEARGFIVFLTQGGEMVREKVRFVVAGENIPLPKDGVKVSQIVRLEDERKKGRDDVVMEIGYLLLHLNDLPGSSDEDEAKILIDITVQAESGAYVREIAQNSIDATKGRQGELAVDFYLQKNERGEQEYVEEAKDNGTGALKEVALLIPKSTKASGGQVELTGFFGTGKYTIFEGVDRLEMITKNQERAYMFSFVVIKDTAGNPIAIRLTAIHKVTDPRVKQGVTIRRIKLIDNTIPELDQILSRRAWKTFAGLSQSENFKIYFVDYEGNRQPLEVRKEVLSETDFKTNKPRETQETNFGKIRIISAEDMPLQILDKAGLRVGEIKEEYLALIPFALRKYIRELGIVIQIPLPLIRNRTAFEQENEYLPVIQKYIAIEFYKAMAYKTLTQTSPQFVFEGFPLDWETNDAYWRSIGAGESKLVKLATKINQGRYSEINEKDLQGFIIEKGALDTEKAMAKFLVLLEVDTGKALRESLLKRRLAIQRERDFARAEAQAAMLRQAGMSVELSEIPDAREVPHFSEKIRQAKGIETGHDQLRNIEKYIIDSNTYTAQEKELVALAFSLARLFGLEQVMLVSREVSFAGGFISYKGKTTMAINQSLAFDIGRSKGSFQDVATETVVHELAHYLEQLMLQDDVAQTFKEGYVAHSSDFTHDAVGTFAESMKYVAAVRLVNHQLTKDTAGQIEQEPPQPQFGHSGNEVDAQLIYAQRAIQSGDTQKAISYIKETIRLLREVDFDELDSSGLPVADMVNQKEVAIWVLEQLKARNLADSEALKLLELLKAGKNGLELKEALGYKKMGTEPFISLKHPSANKFDREKILTGIPGLVSNFPKLANIGNFKLVLEMFREAELRIHSLASKALLAMIQANKGLAIENSVKLIFEFLKDEKRDVRSYVFEILNLLFQINSRLTREENFKVVLEGLRDPDSYVRLSALKALITFIQINKAFANKHNLRSVLELLKENDYFVVVRPAVLEALSRFAALNPDSLSEANFIFILTLLKDPINTVRRYALDALYIFVQTNPAFATEANLKVVIEMLKDSDWRVIHHVNKAWPYFFQANKKSFNAENFALILAILRSSSGDALYAALEGLSYFVQANPALANENSLRLVLEVLPERLTQAPKLLTFFIQANKDSFTEKNFQLVLEMLEPPKWYMRHSVFSNPAQRIFKQPDKSYLRISGLIALPYFVQVNPVFASKDNLRIVLEMLNDPNSEVRSTALEALSSLVLANKTLATEDTLRIVLNMLSDSDDNVVSAALKTLPVLIRTNKALATKANLNPVLKVFKKNANKLYLIMKVLSPFIQANPALSSEISLKFILDILEDNYFNTAYPQIHPSGLKAVSSLIQENPILATETSLKLVLEKLKSPTPEIRRYALELLSAFLSTNKDNFSIILGYIEHIEDKLVQKMVKTEIIYYLVTQNIPASRKLTLGAHQVIKMWTYFKILESPNVAPNKLVEKLKKEVVSALYILESLGQDFPNMGSEIGQEEGALEEKLRLSNFFLDVLPEHKVRPSSLESGKGGIFTMPPEYRLEIRTLPSSYPVIFLNLLMHLRLGLLNENSDYPITIEGALDQEAFFILCSSLFNNSFAEFIAPGLTIPMQVSDVIDFGNVYESYIGQTVDTKEGNIKDITQTFIFAKTFKWVQAYFDYLKEQGVKPVDPATGIELSREELMARVLRDDLETMAFLSYYAFKSLKNEVFDSKDIVLYNQAKGEIAQYLFGLEEEGRPLFIPEEIEIILGRKDREFYFPPKATTPYKLNENNVRDVLKKLHEYFKTDPKALAGYIKTVRAALDMLKTEFYKNHPLAKVAFETIGLDLDGFLYVRKDLFPKENELVKHLFEDASFSNQLETVHILGEIGGETAYKAIQALLDSTKDPLMKEASQNALLAIKDSGRYSPRETEPAVIRDFLSSMDEEQFAREVRAWNERSSAKLSEEALNKIITATPQNRYDALKDAGLTNGQIALLGNGGLAAEPAKLPADHTEWKKIIAVRLQAINVEHTERNVWAVEYFTAKEGLNAQEKEILKLAFWLHDISKDMPLGNYMPEKENTGLASTLRLLIHHLEGAEYAEQFLKERGYDQELIEKIKNIILRHMGPIQGSILFGDKKVGFMELTRLANLGKIEQALKQSNINEERKKKLIGYIEQLKSGFPEPVTKLESIARDIDLLDLVTNGITKVVSLRQRDPAFFKNGKPETLEDSFNSALQSAKDVESNLNTETAKEITKGLLNRLKELNKNMKDKGSLLKLEETLPIESAGTQNELLKRADERAQAFERLFDDFIKANLLLYDAVLKGEPAVKTPTEGTPSFNALEMDKKVKTLFQEHNVIARLEAAVQTIGSKIKSLDQGLEEAGQKDALEAIAKSTQEIEEFIKETKQETANTVEITLSHYLNNTIAAIRLVSDTVKRHPEVWKNEATKKQHVKIWNDYINKYNRIVNYLAQTEHYDYEPYPNTTDKVIKIPEEILSGQKITVNTDENAQVSGSSDKASGLGGIDLQSINIITQPVTTFKLPVFNQKSLTPLVVVGNEWLNIQKMLDGGIIPSGERIKDYLKMCCSRPGNHNEIDKVLACIAEILRMEEERVVTTDPVLKELLVLLDSDKSATQIESVLIKM